MNTSFLQELLATIAEQGRQYIPASLVGANRRDEVEALSEALLTGQGEASGVALARAILIKYEAMPADRRRAYIARIATTMQPDPELIARAATSYIAAPSSDTLGRLQEAVESPRQEFFRRLNLAPGGTAALVGMRRDLLPSLRAQPELATVDTDLQHLFASWFNRGFLVLRRIDWQTPAAILEKIMHYEAVHEIKGWTDLRRRLDPADRRLFAFFHPSMVDEPLIFVEVALTDKIPGSIQGVLSEQPKPRTTSNAPTTAAFYSISNCQEGLRGISFGNFLIKQVVEELAKEMPSLDTFVTLSPIPGFTRWLERELDSHPALLPDPLRADMAKLADEEWRAKAANLARLEAALMPLAAYYLTEAKSADGRPIDPVARFHLGNGARLERLDWLGDVSEKGFKQSHGIMVNYAYDLGAIEANHEAFENDGVIAMSKSVRTLVKSASKMREKMLPKPALDSAAPDAKPQLALPR